MWVPTWEDIVRLLNQVVDAACLPPEVDAIVRAALIEEVRKRLG